MPIAAIQMSIKKVRGHLKETQVQRNITYWTGFSCQTIARNSVHHANCLLDSSTHCCCILRH